jgi:hypothetical protein
MGSNEFITTYFFPTQLGDGCAQHVKHCEGPNGPVQGQRGNQPGQGCELHLSTPELRRLGCDLHICKLRLVLLHFAVLNWKTDDGQMCYVQYRNIRGELNPCP